MHGVIFQILNIAFEVSFYFKIMSKTSLDMCKLPLHYNNNPLVIIWNQLTNEIGYHLETINQSYFNILTHYTQNLWHFKIDVGGTLCWWPIVIKIWSMLLELSLVIVENPSHGQKKMEDPMLTKTQSLRSQ